MESFIEKIKCFRLHLLKQIPGLTTEQWNSIPPGYNNNIVWNIGHLIAAQQNICYVRSGLPITIEERFLSPFLSGTRPGEHVDENDIETIRELFITTIDRLRSDFDKQAFQNYSAPLMIPKVFGFEVNNIHSALEYLLYHEGLHAGVILSLKRSL